MKSIKAYKSIGEVAKLLNLINTKSGKLNTHTIRFWEKSFPQVKPKKFDRSRRYYDEDTINLLKKIQILLKEKGMTINGVKKQLKFDKTLDLDEKDNNFINGRDEIKKKLSNISEKIKNLKKI